jgi:integrase/recombinase XerD
MSTPVVTIFVRHSAKNGKPCKYADDEFSRSCQCRKHFRWTQNGTQYRRQAGTRSWEEAEDRKRQLEDQLAGRTPEPKPEDNVHPVSEAIDIFIQDKMVKGVTPGVIGKYTLELGRLQCYCERQGVFTVPGIRRELLTGFCVTWETIYPSSYTRSKVRERVRSFLRCCYEAQWLPRILAMPKIKVDEPPTMPLTTEEYARLLDALYMATPRRWDGKKSTQGLTPTMRTRLHALIQLMRYSGLAIRDAVTLPRAEILPDAASGLCRIVTRRQKTRTDVSVLLPPSVAKEVLSVPNDNPRYLFWTGEGGGETIAKTWANRYIRPLFEAAGIPCDGHMLSHRLRDTFAVGLLEKGTPMEEVSKMLARESIKTTEKHYAKWVKGRQDRADAFVMPPGRPRQTRSQNALQQYHRPETT